jgi:hypothetical protein
MPTILRMKGYHFFFFSIERNEPIHIHLEKTDSYAKFWLKPIGVAVDYGFNSKQLREISKIIDEKYYIIIIKWNEYFSK